VKHDSINRYLMLFENVRDPSSESMKVIIENA